jgi:RNA polymerase sigma-70 factor (ECF subfamily)
VTASTKFLDDFQALRPKLFGVAYRMLGDAYEAEDVVQDAYLRWHDADHESIEKPSAWLVTVVTRLAIDRARRAAAERVQYVGSWLPEPIATDFGERTDKLVETESDLSIAFLVLLERLGPEERAAFLLRDVFETEYDEIAQTLDSTPGAVRQMVHRARERVRRDQVRFTVAPDARERLLDRFVAAINTADQDELLALFSDEATFTSDGGGNASAARRVVVGRERVARLLAGVSTKWLRYLSHHFAEINGERGVVTMHGDQVFAVTTFAIEGDRIVAGYRMMNPERLRRIRRPDT